MRFSADGYAIATPGPGYRDSKGECISPSSAASGRILKIDSGLPHPPSAGWEGCCCWHPIVPPESPPPRTDIKGCQVSTTTADGSTQTSVTTKSVTCQTSAGDDEDQHQPASLKELNSQTSAKSDAMQDEMGPPQLSDGLLAEVMSEIPPQPFSPPSPLPPVLSPLHSPVGRHGWQQIPTADESPSPPVLQKETVSSPLLTHPDFIDEFEILDAWSPPQVPDHHITQSSWR
ncbi:hypothetical protein CRENBAI_000574 [Crenichthys baileyi]|uniref:Uncharacterized protein n=1 Tax=Crenichthys baileyi TaxID=28760 RepID=A0AAV9SFW3_9TELE